MAIDYVSCLSTAFPSVIVACVGDPMVYENLVWEGGDKLPSKEVLDVAILQQMRDKKIAEMSQACETEITGGFISEALGTPGVYDSEQVDQLNIIGTTTACAPSIEAPEGYPYPYAVREIIDGVVQPKKYVVHTYAQLRRVLFDGAQFKIVRLQKFNMKRDWITNNTVTADDINAITWESNP